MKKNILSLVIWVLFCSCTQDEYTRNMPTVTISIKKIVSQEGERYSFTDLVFFDNQFFLTFRDSDQHVYGRNGVIKLYHSFDGEQWNLIKEFSVTGMDLRDPKFSVNGDELMLYIHGIEFQGVKQIAFRDYNSKYSSLSGWDGLENVLLDNLKTDGVKIQGNESWPWRVTWYNNLAYTIGYTNGIFDMYQSVDGLFFKNKGTINNISGLPTEATIRVNNLGEFYVLARKNNENAMIGKSIDNGLNWDWLGEVPISDMGGPNFLFTKNNGIILSGRDSYHGKVVLGYYDLKQKKYSNIINIPSRSDCGYPGMVMKDNILWLSYYSSHENTYGSSIYIAKVDLSKTDL